MGLFKFYLLENACIFIKILLSNMYLDFFYIILGVTYDNIINYLFKWERYDKNWKGLEVLLLSNFY